jgi:hypothetical protein
MAQCGLAYDAIDRDITCAMLHAEKLARRPAGKYAWSPKLREAGLMARYWHLRLREIEYGYCLRTPILAIKTRLISLHLNLDDDLSSDATILKPRWKKAIKTLRDIRKNAFDHRTVHLHTTLAQYENMPSSSTIKDKIHRIKCLINIESMRKPFREIQSAITTGHRSGLSKLFVPSGVKNKKMAARVCDPDGTPPRPLDRHGKI